MRTILASAVAALAVVATPALADTETVEIRVAYADIDIGTAEGRAELEQRIENAVRSACEVREPLGRGMAKTDWGCVASAKSAALAQIERNNEARIAMGGK